MNHFFKTLLIIASFTGCGFSIHALNYPVEERDSAMGLVKVATACIRSAPGHSNEMVSQVTMGTPLKLLEKADSWWMVESPEGYQGYVIGNGIQPLTQSSFKKWRKAPRVMFTDSYTGRVVSNDGFGTPVSDINSGSIVEVMGSKVKDSTDIRLPDGRVGRLANSSVISLRQLTDADVDVDKIISMARALMGVAYLWGGTTTAGMDCSGLVKICYLNQGIILPRDASQQAMVGKPLGTDYKEYSKGDLVFFKSAKTGRIVHVGIYDKDGLYIHSQGHVRVNSLDPASPLFVPSNILAGACRISGNIGSEGITPVKKHSAYF
ncbi:MAG: C40 family peptidase [Bacteroidales bacterium]|nr:C40 family peptidase [Bacteroidales bacterium]